MCVLSTCRRFPVIWENDDFKGHCFVADNNKEHMWGMHDAASSVCVPAGWTIRLYVDDNYEGATFTVEGPDWVRSLSPYDWNDKADSVQVWGPDE